MLKIGVIGLGSMGKNHARVCSEIEGVDLVGVADVDKETSKNIAKRFNTKAFFDYRELVPKVDAAIVSTPTVTHHDIVMELLNKGKHTLVEKPICDTVGKAQEIIDLAEKQKIVLATGHIERHNPMVKFVKEALDKKEFGELITISSKRVSNFPGRIKDVGVILDFGVHDIDVMRYLVGEVESVYAKAGSFNKEIKHEDYGNVLLTFKNGKCGIVEVNWHTPVKIRKLSLTCSEKYVEADYINQSVTISSSSFNKIDEMNLYGSQIQFNTSNIALQKKEPLRNEIEDFVNAINTNSKPLVTGHDGMQALKIAIAATKSYKEEKEVKII